MITEERDYLIGLLKQSGIKSQVYTSKKRLSQANELHLGAVLYGGEGFSRSGSKKKYTDQEGQRMRRTRLWTRDTVFHVIITDTTSEKVEAVFETFMTDIKKGIEVDRNWVGIEVGQVEWMEKDDSILKAKVAVKVEIIFEGGIYTDTELKTIKDVEISSVTRQGGS